LSDINLQIVEGQTHAIVGPNGAGKSTLLNICVGLIKPDRGTFCKNADCTKLLQQKLWPKRLLRFTIDASTIAF